MVLVPGSGGGPQKPFGSSDRQASDDKCRARLRDADTMIKHRKFQEARVLLSDARSLDPTNPYIAALEERIRVLDTPNPPSFPQMRPLPTQQAPATPPSGLPVEPNLGVELLEKKLRQEIETEFRETFMRELRKAEQNTSTAIEQEREKLERQRTALNAYYEKQIAEMRERLERQYQERLEVELREAEKGLAIQRETEQGIAENEMRSHLGERYHSEIKQLQEKLKEEQSVTLEKERKKFQDRELVLRQEFERRLADTLARREALAQQQQRMHLQSEQQKLRAQVESEFKSELERERAVHQQSIDALNTKLQQAFEANEKKLAAQFEKEVDRRLFEIRKREEEDFARIRAKQMKDIEADFQNKYFNQIATERQSIQQEAEVALDHERIRLKREQEAFIESQNRHIESLKTELRQQMEQEFLRRMEQISTQYEHKMELLGTKMPATKEEAKSFYRDKMRLFYAGGLPSVDQARKLMEIKELLELSFDDHLAIESDIRLQVYVETVEKKILSGELNLKNAGRLSEMKQQFRINAEEASRLEPYILSSFQRLASKGRLLVADDDIVLLRTLEDELTHRGFQVLTCSSVEEAMQQLADSSFDLILSDINFGEGLLDGFKFFTMVQEQAHLRSLPFILMSSLRDGVIVRSGVQLGVDDYLTKPVDLDMLTAVIEGKLKRFRRRDR